MNIARVVLAPLASVLTLSGAAVAGVPIAIDGDFADWGREHVVAVDPAGDATGAFDVTTLWARTQGSVLHLRFDAGRTLNLQSGPQSDGTLLFNLRSNGGVELRINTREREINRRVGDEEWQDIGWHGAGYWSAPTFASHEFEARVDLNRAGFAPGDVVTLTLAGSDLLDNPVVLTVPNTDPSEELSDFVLPDLDEGQLRVLSLNTLRNGIVDPERSDAILRLLSTGDPDVILLQEEYNTSAEDVEAAIEGRFGTDWNIVKVRDNVVASPLPVTAIQSFDDSYAAAIVTDAQGADRLILSVHPKCCGHIGSDEDERRINQTRAMIRTVALARQRFGSGLPVLIAGDWNLVGSRSPLDLLTDPTGPNMQHLVARHAGGADVFTWYAPNSSFGPGLLDLAVTDATSAPHSRALVLDSRLISEESVRGLGLQPDDSSASDHLLLLIDFGRDVR